MVRAVEDSLQGRVVHLIICINVIRNSLPRLDLPSESKEQLKTALHRFASGILQNLITVEQARSIFARPANSIKWDHLEGALDQSSIKAGVIAKASEVDIVKEVHALLSSHFAAS